MLHVGYTQTFAKTFEMKSSWRLESRRYSLRTGRWRNLSIESSTDSSFYVFRALVTTALSTISSTTVRKSRDKWTFVSTESAERLPILGVCHPSIRMYIHIRNTSRPFHRSLSPSIYTYVRVCNMWYVYIIRFMYTQST